MVSGLKNFLSRLIEFDQALDNKNGATLTYSIAH